MVTSSTAGVNTIGIKKQVLLLLEDHLQATWKQKFLCFIPTIFA